MKKYKYIISIVLASVLFYSPIFASSIFSKTFTRAAWIPYWKKTEGTTEAYKNFDNLDIISPFSYEVREDGTLSDKLKINEEPWLTLLSEAKRKNIKVYPTLAWFSRASIYDTLSSKEKRKNHIENIVTLLKSSDSFSGVDIDYENKSADTRIYFSAFLKELSLQLKPLNKKLICTIEARIPVESRYKKEKLTKEFLKTIEYSNDFPSIGKYCDEVRLMAYDQSRTDIKLNEQNGTSTPYMPISDIRWVEKVIKLASKDIKPSKIILGIASFGYKYELVPSKDGFTYERLRAVTFNEAYNLSKSVGTQASRGLSGELSFVFNATGTKSYTGQVGETSFGKYKTSGEAPLHLVSFPDGESVLQKVNLAKKLKLGGVVVFKLDGNGDQAIWDVFRQ